MEKIVENVYYVGIKDENRKIFDELVPLDEGTTYNSYLIIGKDKNALIDTSYPPKIDEFVENLKKNNVKIDYIISNHAEQDHSGAIPRLLEIYPEALVVTNEKVASNLYNLLNVLPEKIKIIQDGECLDLGLKTLEFKLAPFVHWPDTMFTYLKEDKILFTCDFLGAHRTTSPLFAENSQELLKQAKKYYCEIMMPFRKFAQKYVSWIKALKPKIVAPSHGPVYLDPDFILDAYEDWTSDIAKPLVLIPYVSMYEATEKMVLYLEKILKDKHIDVRKINLMHEEIGTFLDLLVDAKVIIFGSSMVLAQAHPQVVCFANLINLLKPKFSHYAIVGSFGWGGQLVQSIERMFTQIKPEKLADVVVKGANLDENIKEQLNSLADKIEESVSVNKK